MVLVNTCGFVEKAKQDSIDTLLAAADTGAKVVAAGCMAERYGRELAEQPPRGAGRARLRRLPGHRRPARRGPRRRELRRRTPRATGASCCRSPRCSGRHANVVVPGHAVVDEHTPAHLRKVLRRRLDNGPVASLKLASGCDRRCSFCAIPAFRGAFVSRGPAGAARRGRVAGPHRRPRAGPGQREQHLLRQGPRRPAAAGEAAAAARRGRRHRPGPGQLPAARRDPARPGRGDRHHARRGRLLRPVVPALQRAGAAPDAAFRLHRALPGAARLGPRAGPRGGRPQQLHRRVPRRDRARRRRAGPLPHRGAPRRDRRLRLQRRGRHRGRRPDRQARRGHDQAAVRPDQRAGRGARAPSGPRTGSAPPSRCWSTRSTTTGSRAAPRTRRPRSTAPRCWSPRRPVGVDLAALRPGDLVRARVTGTDGVDLMAVPVEMVVRRAGVGAVTDEPVAGDRRAAAGVRSTTRPTC